MVLRMLRTIFILSVAIAALMLSSCATTPTGQGNQIVVQASAKQSGLTDDVTAVRLMISGTGIEDIVEEGNFVDGVVTFEVEVPSSVDLTFTMSALDIEGTVLFEGTQVTNLAPGVSTNIDITMTPQVPMVRVTPRYSQIGSGIASGELTVEVSNVDNLFGVSFRIEFDSSIVKIGDVTEGSLFNPNQTIFFSRNEGNYVAVASTMQNSQTPQGVDGGGTVAIFQLLPGTSPGISELTINPETLRLIDWQGNDLPPSGQLFIESGEVETVAQ